MQAIDLIDFIYIKNFFYKSSSFTSLVGGRLWSYDFQECHTPMGELGNQSSYKFRQETGKSYLSLP